MNFSDLRFEVHPSVVYQLGESLISDSVQAIIELVKNSYDADASYSKVVIDTQGFIRPDDAYYTENGGVITIEDDGCGMSLNDLVKGWLTISNRQKQTIKQNRETTAKGRTPLGDKGLGRLGVQKLGKNLEIYTRKNETGAKAYHIGFSWLDFASSEKLEKVEIRCEEAVYPKSNGTKIVISGIMEPEFWREKQSKSGKRQNTATDRLKTELSRMISPYKEIRNFSVYIEIDNRTIDLIEISDSIRNNAILRYQITFDGKKLAVSGKAKLDYFLPNTPSDKIIFEKTVHNDNGNKFYTYLSKQKFALDYGLVKSNAKKWFVEFSFKRLLVNINKIEYINDDTIANPGIFSGEVDAFSLKDDSQRITDYRNIIKDISGIRVYRDGFAIRVDQDWLGLGRQQTSGMSFYGLRPMNTLGFISLSARENMDLEETTDREGFKDTAYYRNFFLLLQEFVKFSGDIQQFLRRSWLEFRNQYKEAEIAVDSQASIEAITRSVKKKLNSIPNHENSKEIKDSVKLLDVIDDRFAMSRQQTELMYESMALGLTAEALSHEIGNITDQLARRAKALKIDLDKRGIKDKAISVFLEYVKSSVLALQKQMSFLAPTLRYVRERRDEINVTEFMNELIDYYKSRLQTSSINIALSSDSLSSFRVKINRGKLIQVLDNLILNSEYWLKEDMEMGRIKKAVINITISEPYIYVFDNGRGIDQSVENTLFEPFITTKARGHGRGLGLFVIRQLLSYDGCGIELLPERNKKNRLFKFQIDLKGVICE